MNANLPKRVVKIGGSLLRLEDLPIRLERWLSQQPQMPTAIVIGGGTVIDAMRDLSDRFSLDQVAMHWRCVKLLHSTFEVLCELIPDALPIDSQETLRSWASNATADSRALVAVESFYQPERECLVNLPASWETTTDSIAAELAKQLSAAELVLCKSVELPNNLGWHEAAQRGIVDNAFPNAAKQLESVRVVDLKSQDFRIS